MGLKMSARVIRIILCILFLEEMKIFIRYFFLSALVRENGPEILEINKLRQRSQTLVVSSRVV